MSFEDIPVGVWRSAWAELEEVVIGGGCSRDLVRDARPDTSRASHWLVSEKSIVFLKAAARLAYIRCEMKWNGPQTTAVARFLIRKHFPVVRDNQLREGIGGSGSAKVLGEVAALQTPDYETFRRLSRPEQADFRAELKETYGARCAISGCEVDVALDACHILSHADGGPSEAANGLLLRRDLHRLFDLGLIAVDPATRSWRFHDELFEHYGDLFKDRHEPHFEPHDPRLERLAKHWDVSQLTS